MALIKCPECQKEISDKAITCPHCGYPISSNQSKLYTVILESCNSSKIPTIKQVRITKNLDLLPAKQIVECAPIILECNIPLEKANQIKTDFENIGATITVRKSNENDNTNTKINTNKMRCPTCGSTEIEKISTTSKITGGLLFGLFSSNARNTFHCKTCNYKW